MTRTQRNDNTHSRDSSTNSAKTRQIPLRARGLHVHDAHDQPEQQQHEDDLRSELRKALFERVKKYRPPPFQTPYTKKHLGAQCARRANRHPICRDQLDRDLMSAYWFYAAINVHMKEKKFDRYICNPDQNYLSKKLGVSVRTIYQRTKRFKKYKAIDVLLENDDSTGRTMNFYVLPG